MEYVLHLRRNKGNKRLDSKGEQCVTLAVFGAQQKKKKMVEKVTKKQENVKPVLLHHS